jgi:signal transduction histidine kinase
MRSSCARAFRMRTAPSRPESMARMRASIEPRGTRRTRVLDLGLTAAALVLGLLTLALQRSADAGTWRRIDAVGVALVVLMALPAATCRRAPVASAVTALTAALAAAAAGYPPTSGWFAALLIAAAAVYLTDRRRAVALGTFALAGDILASIAAADAAGERLSAFQLVANVCVIGIPLLLADLLREQRRLLAQVRDQSGRLAELRAAEAGEAAARERVRIARDVHDIVGNQLSAIAVQAGAGRRLVGAKPDEAGATFEHIARMAREALAETRAAVRGMREDVADDAPGAPRLADLDALLDAVRASGVEVRVLRRPPDDALTADVQAAAFRIVQESLTNVARYARPPRAAISIHLTNGEAFIDVHDDGARRAEPAGQGTGIAGMRERAALVGGRLAAGPSPDGLGWRVHAVLPAPATRSPGAAAAP